MVSCCIPVCKSTKISDSALSFHRIPSDPVRRDRWIEIIKKECDFEPSKYGFLCSLHFNKKCFINGGSGLIKKLSRAAYPTLFLADPNNGIKVEKEEVQTGEYSSGESSLDGETKFSTGVKREFVDEDSQLSASSTFSDKQTQTMWFMDYDSRNTAVNIYNAHLSTLDINRINCSPFIKHLLLKTKSEIMENRKKIKALHMHKFRSQKRIQQLELMVKNLEAANNSTKVTRPKSSCSTMVSDSYTQSDSSPSSSPEVVSSYLLDNIVNYDHCYTSRIKDVEKFQP